MRIERRIVSLGLDGQPKETKTNGLEYIPKAGIPITSGTYDTKTLGEVTVDLSELDPHGQRHTIVLSGEWLKNPTSSDKRKTTSGRREIQIGRDGVGMTTLWSMGEHTRGILVVELMPWPLSEPKKHERRRNRRLKYGEITPVEAEIQRIERQTEWQKHWPDVPGYYKYM